MRFTKLSLFIAGAIGILIFAVPRAAHAVVATLVQVANTASSPVVTQSIGQQGAQIVQIECGNLPLTSYNFGCTAVPATGFPASPPQNSSYIVPVGETLVVTAVDILSGTTAGSPCMSPASALLITYFYPANPERKFWIVPSGTGTAHYVYPSGILFASGTTIIQVDNRTSTCSLTLDMHGYLTAQ